jgi:hypothetical protein
VRERNHTINSLRDDTKEVRPRMFLKKGIDVYGSVVVRSSMEELCPNLQES